MDTKLACVAIEEGVPPPVVRRQSSSQASEDSQTAADFLRSQLQLEADAREALPYSIEHCTKPLGRLRQSVFACLTCNPPPEDPAAAYDRPAGVCYACSVQCHGEHTLVEIFSKRNFACDCGTARFPDAAPCCLRVHPTTNTKGDVHGETPEPLNQYNHNFRNRFCGCAGYYDPFQQKGTMFQCLGLGTAATGGCGEDWWHPGCIVGLGPMWFESEQKEKKKPASDGELPTISEDAVDETLGEEDDDDEPPMPPGFPKEEDFEGFLCYKCVEAHPWIKRYAGAPGFLPAVFYKEPGGAVDGAADGATDGAADGATDGAASRKRKAEDDDVSVDAKRIKSDGESEETSQEKTEKPETVDKPETADKPCLLDSLPPAPSGRFSLFFTESFREHLCRCARCFPQLQPHPQLLEEEETYEPPASEEGGDGNGSENGGSGGPSHGSGSLYDRGESALRNVDRVRAIEGVMAYNHLKDKLKPFFQQFAESGQAISAEDIKAYFAQLRGDEQAIREAGEAAKSDSRREQEGY